jgi:integrase
MRSMKVVEELDNKTLRAYAESVRRLMLFLESRGSDVLTATEDDLEEFRYWRKNTPKASRKATPDKVERPIKQSTWVKEAAGINSLHWWLVGTGRLRRRPWRSSGKDRDSFSNAKRQNLPIRHLSKEQYHYFRDVGLGGQRPDGTWDPSYRGRNTERNRAACDMALLTGMRQQEWSTLLLPELRLDEVPVGEPGKVTLAACAKYGLIREVDVASDAMAGIRRYLLLERAEAVRRAQQSLQLKWRRGDLLMVSKVADGMLHGVLDGIRVELEIADMGPERRRIAVLDTGDGLEPLAVFVGTGGRMVSPSAWDDARYRAWARMRAYQAWPQSPVMPVSVWRLHDLRHTFALRLLLFLTVEHLGEAAAKDMPMATLIEHMTMNPLIRTSKRLGHSTPASTYRYVDYLKKPQDDVEQAFRGWAADESSSYVEIGSKLMGLEAGDAAQG